MRVILRREDGRIIRVIEGSPREVVYEFAKAVDEFSGKRKRIQG